MSSTHRCQRPRDPDFYPTPAWCVHRLLEAVALPDGWWLEPAVGDGAIVQAVDSRIGCTPRCKWKTFDIRQTEAAMYVRDFLAMDPPEDPMFDGIITNPPYNQALEFVRLSIKWSPIVVMLLRLNWIASQKRHAFIREHPPDVYVLPNRPSFTGRGTDSIEYAWFVWGQGGGRLSVLNLTPLEERR